jgi:hypothetical protein
LTQERDIERERERERARDIRAWYAFLLHLIGFVKGLGVRFQEKSLKRTN